MKKEKNEKVEELSIDEMNRALIALRDSEYWNAYKKFIMIRSVYAEGSLFTIDPFKNPTEMARNQGIRIGLNDLEAHINTLKVKIKEEEEEENKNAVNG